IDCGYSCAGNHGRTTVPSCSILIHSLHNRHIIHAGSDESAPFVSSFADAQDENLVLSILNNLTFPIISSII
ncbi:MAG TPA: hypothetical protein VNW73_04710, partial [Ktedonobacteraceae bacterium]|nr:hypothetical protein [Ktedonobacteraceae bacterium]